MKNVLICLCLTASLVFICTLAGLALYYGPASCAAARDTLIHSKGLVTEIQRAATRSVETSDDTDKAVKHIDQAAQDASVAIRHSQETLQAATGATNALADTERAATARLNALAETQGRLDNAVDAVTGAVPHVQLAVDNLAEDEDTFNTFMVGPATGIVTDSRAFLNGPLTFATNNAGKLEDTTNLTVDQARKRWVAPCDGKHCKLKAVGATTLNLLGVGGTLWRDTK